MKKLLKRFSGGIINKLFLLILITVLLCAVVFFSITGYQNKMLSDLNIETSNRQQTAIADTTVSVMKETILNTLNQTTRLKALSTDEIFRSAKARVTLLQDYATKMYAHPEFYTSRSYSGPDPSLNGQLVSQVIFADGVDPSDPQIYHFVIDGFDCFAAPRTMENVPGSELLLFGSDGRNMLEIHYSVDSDASELTRMLEYAPEDFSACVLGLLVHAPEK